MAEIVIGRSLDHLRIKVVAGSQQAFALAWKDNAGNPADITAYTFSIVLDDATTWTAAKNASTTTWTLSAAAADKPTGYIGGKLIATDANGPMIAYNVTVEVQ